MRQPASVKDDSFDGLLTWDEIEQRHPWRSLLLGNGASVAVWAQFAYGSMFEAAALGPEARALFSDLNSTNFEHALAATQHAIAVRKALQRSKGHEHALYEEIQGSLFTAVQGVHVPVRALGAERRSQIKSALLAYDTVFTTNYDLVAYWAIMEEQPHGRFVDYLFPPGFDPNTTDLWPGRHEILYLHGAVHLFVEEREGLTGKWEAGSATLLSTLRSRWQSTRKRPLVVTEGASREKRQAIRRNEYLSFGYDRLLNDTKPIVLFGHSLSDQDQHIAEGVMVGRDERSGVAVGVFPTGESRRERAAWVRRETRRVAAVLHRLEPLFFDSRTHPLGAPELRVAPGHGS